MSQEKNYRLKEQKNFLEKEMMVCGISIIGGEKMSRDKRKTITFEPEIFKKIQQYRAEALRNANINQDELTFTQAVNILCKEALDNRK